MSVAAIAVGVVGAGATIYAANQSADAAQNAANAQANASNNASNLQYQEWQQGQQNLQPWLQTGTSALNQLAFEMGQGNAPTAPDVSSYYWSGALPQDVVIPGASGPGPNNQTYAQYIANGGNLTGWMNYLEQNGIGGFGQANATPLSGAANPSTNMNATGSFKGSDGNTYVYDPSSGKWINQAGYNAAQQAYQGQLASYNNAKNNPSFGVLTKQNPYAYKTNPYTNPGSFTMADFYANQDPAYQWDLQQGLAAINQNAAAKGGFFTGQTGIDLNNYAQGEASNEYANAYNRWNQQNQENYQNWQEQNNNQYNQWNNQQATNYNMLASLAGVGQTTANQINDLGSNYASNAGNLAVNSAINSGNLNMAAANYNTQGIQNAWNQGMGALNYYNNYQQQQTLNNLLSNQSGWGDTSLGNTQLSLPSFGSDIPYAQGGWGGTGIS